MSRSPQLRSAQTIAVLAVTQIIGWGTSFDMLGVMGRAIAPDLGLANEVVFSGLSIMMVISALAGPATGRLIARHGAARILGASSLAFALGPLALALCGGVVVYALAWVVLGVAAALGLSVTAYAAVVEREGANSRRVIGILLLFTGLSATVFWPVLTLVTGWVGWRLTFIACAALHILVCLPLHLFGLPAPGRGGGAHEASATAPIALSPSTRLAAFVFIAAATAISSFVTFGLSPSFLEILRQSGASPALALQLGAARGVIGISARLVDMLIGKRGSPVASAAAGIGMMLASFLMLGTIIPSTPLLVGFVVIYGLGSGVMTVARALLPLAFFSAREYGLQSARLSLPQNLANAAAPVIFTALIDRAGASAAILACAILTALALVFVALLSTLARNARAALAQS